MPLFSIPVYRLVPHDLVYWSGASGYDIVNFLSRTSGAATYLANDPQGDVILNQGGPGYRFTTPSSLADAVCRSLSTGLVQCWIEDYSSGSDVLRMTAGILKTPGGGARELVLAKQLTAGDGASSATLTFSNDLPGSGVFSIYAGVSSPTLGNTFAKAPIIDPPGGGVLDVVVGDGVSLHVKAVNGNLLTYSGGTTIDAGGKLTVSQPGAKTDPAWPLADVAISGELHLVAKSTFAPNGYSRIELGSTVATTGAGVLTVEGGLVASNSLGGVMNMIYLTAGCTVAMSAIAGVLGGVGTITGPVSVVTNGYIMAARDGVVSDLAVSGALTINGGSLYVTSGAFNSSTGKNTAVNAINCTGAFAATSVSAVRIGPQVASGTYEIITASSITGTLPDPVEPGNFSHYNYNATSIEIVLM